MKIIVDVISDEQETGISVTDDIFKINEEKFGMNCIELLYGGGGKAGEPQQITLKK